MCSDKDLASIAQELISWEQVYLYLDVTEPEATAIRADHPHDYNTQKIKILQKWKTKKGQFQGTFKVLSEVFVEQNYQQMVEVITTVAAKAYKGLNFSHVASYIARSLLL